MAWKTGPLPPDTYGWGGATLTGEGGSGFHFADFVGDHAVLVPDGRTVTADQIAMYDNALTLPPGVRGRAGQDDPAVG